MFNLNQFDDKNIFMRAKINQLVSQHYPDLKEELHGLCLDLAGLDELGEAVAHHVDVFNALQGTACQYYKI